MLEQGCHSLVDLLVFYNSKSWINRSSSITAIAFYRDYMYQTGDTKLIGPSGIIKAETPPFSSSESN